MNRIRLLVLLPILFCVGCATAPDLPPEPLPAPIEPTQLSVATEIIDLPLNVSIQLFSTDLEAVGRGFRSIRSAEAAYVPIHLADTLNRTGYWGAVNVVPTLDTAAELLVTGHVIHSDATKLNLQIRVQDSRGVVWFDETFVDYPTGYDKVEQIDPSQIELRQDAFQNLYNRIANRMASYASSLTQPDRNRVLDMAMLRYAVLLSPTAFGGYLATDENGQLNVQGLPARNDPLYQRVSKIRERESAMQDVVDAHFDNFYQGMQAVYPYWRQLSHELLTYNQQLATTQNRRSNLEDVYRMYREAKMNEDELRELAESFEREMEPTVTELEGRVIELQGSLQTQYKLWRRLLQEIYEERRGLP